MNALKSRETEVLRHALGLKPGSKITYRNRFLAAPHDVANWRSLVERGYAKEGAPTNLGIWFWATRKGFDAVKRRGEKIGPDEEQEFKRMEADDAKERAA